MQPRFSGRLSLADAVTVANAMLGFVAIVATTVSPTLAARLILLAAIADGLDGVLARHVGHTPAGEHLDSLADVASFGVAPALLVVTIAQDAWGSAFVDGSLLAIVGLAVSGLFVAMAVVRLGLYTAYDVGNDHTEGVQTTLAATVLAAAVLGGLQQATALVAGTAIFAYLMVVRVTYPDLYARDAILMGGVQTLAVVAPTVLNRFFPRTLFGFALAYLLFAPKFYWRS